MKEEPVGLNSMNVLKNPEIEEQIRLRAYALYEERGREDGHDVEDWLRAEAEVESAAQPSVARRAAA